MKWTLRNAAVTAGLLLGLVMGLVAAATPAPAQSGPSVRRALVIGNQAYQSLNRLQNPVRDAEAVVEALQGRGFSTLLARDATSEELRATVDRFVQNMGDADVALFYYAGHGVALRGENYLAPIDADLNRERTLVRLNDILAAIASSNARAKLFFVDACRSDPLGASASVGVEWQSGLVDPNFNFASVRARERDATVGNIIVFSAAPGSEASDGSAGRHSPFAQAFLGNIDEPLEVGALLANINREVITVTNRAQIPWVTYTMAGQLYLAGVPESPVERRQRRAIRVRPPT